MRFMPGRPRHSPQDDGLSFPQAGAVSLFNPLKPPSNPPPRILRGKVNLMEKRPPTEAALLCLLIDNSGDESRATPKLNRGTFENFLGFFDSFGVVFASEAPVPNKILSSDEIGAVIRHPLSPKDPVPDAEGYVQLVDVGTIFIQISHPLS
jgi:hypothetical protein